MRSIPALAILFALLLQAPSALAVFEPNAFDRVDPRGDEQVLFYNVPVNSATQCHDAAIDIRLLSARVEDGVFRSSLSVTDLGSGHVTCSGASVDRSFALYTVHLQPNFPGTGDVLALKTFLKPEGPLACGQMELQDGTTSLSCVGTFQFDGDRLTWELPLRGEVVVDNGDLRTYDLSGTPYDVHATAASYLEPKGAYPAVADITIPYTMQM